MPASPVFELNTQQTERLLTLRAAWDEGEDEERLERLRLREEDAEIVRAFGQLLDATGFTEGANLTYAQMSVLLGLIRALAPNPNLDARLLRTAGEPEQINHDLRDLLFGPSSVPLRLRGFLSRRHAGGQTAMQFLCAHQPETWPLVTRVGLRALEIAPEQQQAALNVARERFDLPAEVQGIEAYSNHPIHVGIPDTDPILRLLADVIIYEAACEILEASDYLAVHRLLTRGMTHKPGRGRKSGQWLAVSGQWTEEEKKRKGEEERRGTGDSEQGTETNSPSTINYQLSTPSSFHESRSEYESADVAPPLVDVSGCTQSELLRLLEREIRAQGFTYPALTIRDYYLCLQSKPFALLSGLSGTGKTRLTSLFAHALCGAAASQYRLLPARPDWNDSTPLLGYVNLLVPDANGRGSFVSTPFLEFLLRASRPENTNRAFFLCLDEMNLARVEHYFAEILSAMETAGRELILPDGRMARLPANWFLTGTLNLDEATHSLSRKVLDRANTLTFQDVCLREDWHEEPEAGKTSDGNSDNEARYTREIRQGLFLQARVSNVGAARARLRQISPTGSDFAAQVVNVLADVNALLEPHGLHFAYRVRDEALRYCANSFDVDGRGLLTPDSPDDKSRNLQIALDLQLLQKVLPRLTGTLEQLEIPLAELLRCVDRHDFEQTTRRIRRLQARLLRDGYAAFDAA